MEKHLSEEKLLVQLRRRRNRYVLVAVAALASIGLALPRMVTSYRELKAVNEETVRIQEAIVDQQQQLVAVQNQILRIQDQIRKRVSK